MIKLTHRQEHFIKEVACGKTQSEAYLIAYPVSKSWKPASVHESASRLMANVKVVSRLRELLRDAADVAKLEVAAALRQIRDIACSDVGKLVDLDGRVKLPHELDEATRAAVKTFKIDEYGRIEYQFWDKNAALDKACRILGLYREEGLQKPAPVYTRIELVAMVAPSAGDPHVRTIENEEADE